MLFRSTKVAIDAGGATVTYYKDEIDRMEGGSPAAVAPAAPVAPAAVPVAVAPVVAAPVVAAPVATAPISEAKKQLIAQFIEVFGTRASMIANFDQMMSSLPADQAGKLRKAFNIDEIIQALLPLYDKYFSEADLTAMIAFYNSPEGKKLVQTIPQLMRDSVEVSAKYFENHMPEEFKTGSAAAPATPAAPEAAK